MRISDYIGEATAYDKKLELERKEPLSWLKSVSAFANTLGGVLTSVSGDAEIGTGRGQDGSPKSSPKSNPKLNDTDSRLLQFMAGNPKVTILELASQLQMSRAGVKKAIERVRSAGLLRRVGSLRGGHWEVVREVDFTPGTA